MNCEEAREALLNSLAGSIPAERHLPMEKHIATCEACRRFTKVQLMLDARLAAAVPVVALSPQFRSSLREKCRDHTMPDWPESLPDVAHLTGCLLAIALLLLVMPQYSRTVVLAGSEFTAVTYFFQAVLRSSLEKLDA
jgi:predicted anti-sigma-YlaC factor YlaD